MLHLAPTPAKIRPRRQVGPPAQGQGTVHENEIAAAAEHVAECCRQMLSSMERGDASPGEVDDLSSDAFHTASIAVLTRSIPVRVLKDLGSACGDIADSMVTVASRRPELDDDAWRQLQDVLAAAHDAWGPYEFVVADNRRLDLVRAPAPTDTRFDLLATLATREAAEQTRDAAARVLARITDPPVNRRSTGDDADA